MRTWIASLTLLLIALPWAPTRADACLNGTIMEQNEVVRNIRLAEKALGKGQNRRVLRLLDADHYMVDSPRLLKKVRILKTVARMRRGKTKGAERIFRKLLAKDKDNPYLQTRLAEALHKRRGHDAVEAWRIMVDLEERDLIPDAHGYAVLARLRQRNKDASGQQRALVACRAMAGKHDALCT
jgi:predicted Zn-dependent protease